MRLSLLALCAISVFAQQASLNIPTTRPRLWWTAERLQAARTWYAANSFTPRADDPIGQAFRYQMTREAAYARRAIDWAMDVQFSTSGTSSNEARWSGEAAIVVYDWCYDQFTATERTTFLNRWNGYLDALRQKDWGGVDMPQSNYYWGYFRNELLWGIASYHENPMAMTFLNHALTTRWQNSFLPHANGRGRGGVPHEGSQYGRYLLDYSVVPFVTASLVGRPVYTETDFFKSAVFYLIYATLPGITAGEGYDIFPSNDDEVWRDGSSAEDTGYANFMAAAAGQWNGTRVAEYARQWMRQTGVRPAPFVQSVTGSGPERVFTNLPLDYYAPGLMQLFGRNVWGANSTVFHVQLGVQEGVGHAHQDFGNWQMWRNGRWLSRETVAYTDEAAGYGGTGTVEGPDSILHNTILMNRQGHASDPPENAVVRRLESRPEYSYIVADLTPVYRNTERPSSGNAAVSHVEREYLFIRPLETMVILDRLRSTSASTLKTFVAHFEQRPVIEDSTHVLGVNGTQALRLTTLAPQNPSYRVVTEGGSVGQYRLEVETSGTADSYFLHVLQGRDASGQNLQAAVSETASSFNVTLTHPTAGYCRVVFDKGMSSAGGGISCSPTSMPAQVQPFTTTVQGISVTNDGPVWAGGSGGGQDQTPPVIGSIAASAGINTATISWTTNEPATSQVEYGATVAYGQSSPLSTTTRTSHSVALSNLTAGTLYHYRVLSRDAAGNLAASPDRTFTTTAPAVQYSITTLPGANGTITPPGPVMVAAGGSQTFQITPAVNHRIADVQVNGASVGTANTYTFTNVRSNGTISARFEVIPTVPAGQTVPITVHAYASGNGPANLVSNAIPFAPGVLSSASNVRVLDGSTEVPVAARVLASWPQDGSIRSLLLQFSAPFTTATKNYTVEIGVRRTTTDRAFTAVTWDVPVRIFTLPAAYLSSSLIFWEQLPLGQSGFPAWESKMLNNYGSISTVGTAPCVRDDQYYDSITTTYQLYARSGTLQHLVNARRWAVHHRRDQVYLSGTSIGHPRCSSNYLNNTRYTFPQGLVQDYFMFGDEEDRRVSGIIVDNFYTPLGDSYYYQSPNSRGWWTEREPAFALIGMLAHYEGTGDATYLNRVRDRINRLRQMQVDNGRRAWVHNLYDHDPSEGCSTSDYGSSPWMSGLLLEAVIKYHKLTGDAGARESILMAVDDLRARYLARGQYAGASFVYLGCPAYTDGTPDLDNLISHAFGYAYKLTGNQTYLNLGRTIFNTGVNNGYAGAHKQYNQQFRSSGHFVAYIAQPVSGDTTAPTVSVTSPTGGQTVSGTITATATASDNVGVTGVQFQVDGQPYGTEDTTSPYSVSVNTTTLSNGSHTITAVARDAAGNTRTSAAVSVTVNNADSTQPTVSVTSPTGGQTVSGTITATATATDNVGVSGVQFLVDGQPYGAEDTTAPYAVSINTASLTSGSHTIAARARDAAGNTRTSSAVSFTVRNTDTTQPAVAVTSPTGGQTVSGTITATATATDNVGVSGVQFLVDGQPYGAEDTTAAYAVSINTTSLTNGSHTIAARARDAAGNARTSSAISFTVRNTDTTQPTVAVTSPTGGQTVSGTITATANASDNVGVAGVRFLIDGQLYGAEDTTAPYAVSINTTSLTNGSHTIAARARDGAGNTRTSVAISFTVRNADTTQPTVSVTSPGGGQTVSGTITATANASDNVGVAGVRFLIDGQLYGAEDTTAPYAVSINTTSLTNGSHTIAARARDAAGNTRTSSAVSFAVRNSSTDTIAPTVHTVWPPAGVSVGGTITAVASASDNVGITGVRFHVNGRPYGSVDTSAPYTVQIDTGQLPPGIHVITSGATDAAGNTAMSPPVMITVRR